MIELTLTRLDQEKDSTFGKLKHGDKFLGFIIEDAHHEPKIPSKTRIPAGRYKIEKKTSGKFFLKYSQKYGHTFVPHLLDVPGFEGILIHMGNTIDDTRGCLLPNQVLRVDSTGNYAGQISMVAYDELIDYLTPHDDIWITIIDNK